MDKSNGLKVEELLRPGVKVRETVACRAVWKDGIPPPKYI